MTFSQRSLQLRSLLSADGELKLSLVEVVVPEPVEDEVIVEVRAAPLNPSDLAVLVGPADPASAKAGSEDGRPVATLRMPPGSMDLLKLRIGQSLPAGLEGAGIVVAAGKSPVAQALIGRAVALGGGMYAQYRKANVAECFVLPEDVSPEEGASAFVNPMTALGMIETMRREGHKAMVHTAAASNLGQMLARLCVADGVDLVAVVRNPQQADILKAIGVAHVCDSTSPDFDRALMDAVAATGATLAFDALSGGTLAGRILRAMDVAASATTGIYSTYGSPVHKQVYLYGGLNPGPVIIEQNIGRMWGIAGWHLVSFMQKTEPRRLGELRGRVASELKTTFASHHTGVLSLMDVLRPENIQAYMRRATGEKFLLNPALA